MKTCTLAGLVFPLLLAASASAQQVITYLTPIDPVLSLPAAAGDTLQLPGFDPGLGTLLGVRLTFTGYAAQLAKGENLGSASAYSYNVTSELSLGRTGGPEHFTFAPVTLSGSGNLATFDGADDFAGPSGFNSTLVTTPINGLYDVPAELVSTYLGLAPIDFTAHLAGSAFISSSGNFYSQTSNGAGGTLQVAYTYALIPEPSAYAAATGLFVLGYVTLRRRCRPVG